MASFNKVILMGNMTADPELKQTTAGTSVCSFSLAVNRPFTKAEQGQQTVDFLNIVTWGKRAEFVARYFKKGSNVLVCGRLQTRTWVDNQGQKRYATEIVADEVSFGESKAASTVSNTGADTVDELPQPAAEGQWEELSDDEQLPF
jgi:single-strand DNA-binding protein